MAEASEASTKRGARLTAAQRDWPHQHLGRAELRLAITRAFHGFLRHRGLDSAAALAFFSALAVFPASLTVVSTVALLDDKTRAPGDILRVVADIAPHSTVVTIDGPLRQLLSIPNAGFALAIGLVLVLWTLSGYVSAVGRVVNTAYDIDEGRRWVRMRATMLLVAAGLTVLGGIAALLLLGTPTVASAVADSLRLPHGAAIAWDILKWPVLLLIAVVAVAVLYYYSPNVRHLRMRWATAGALLTIVAWVLATTGFAIYVLNFSHYNRVYGWLGGAIVLLLWLYLSNLVVVAGAEMDAELVRVRQLVAGVHAETEIQLPLRNTRRIEAIKRWQARDQSAGRSLRERSDRNRLRR